MSTKLTVIFSPNSLNKIRAATCRGWQAGSSTAACCKSPVRSALIRGACSTMTSQSPRVRTNQSPRVRTPRGTSQASASTPKKKVMNNQVCRPIRSREPPDEQVAQDWDRTVHRLMKSKKSRDAKVADAESLIRANEVRQRIRPASFQWAALRNPTVLAARRPPAHPTHRQALAGTDSYLGTHTCSEKQLPLHQLPDRIVCAADYPSA